MSNDNNTKDIDLDYLGKIIVASSLEYLNKHYPSPRPSYHICELYRSLLSLDAYIYKSNGLAKSLANYSNDARIAMVETQLLDISKSIESTTSLVYQILADAEKVEAESEKK